MRSFAFFSSTLFLLLFLCIFNSGECRKGELTEVPIARAQENGPWFTGPLLSPSGNITPYGYIDLEPYVAEIVYTGRYDKDWDAQSHPYFYSTNTLVFFEAGLTKFMSISTYPQFYYNATEGKSAAVFGDLPIALNFTLLTEEKEEWHPAIKFSLKEIFPTGKYQRLNPNKNSTDLGGGGSFVSCATLVVSKLIKLPHNFYLSSRLAFQFCIPSSVNVHGINAYGGGIDTRGTIYPGIYHVTYLGLEFSINKNWVLALDIQNNYNNKSKFMGVMGNLNSVSPVSTVLSSANQISIAPAIEYNFSQKLGIIAGSWFTVAGRNSSQFFSGVIALDYYTNVR